MLYAKLRCILLSIAPEKQMAYFVTLTLQADVPYSLPLHWLWQVEERGMQHVFHLHLNGEVVEVLAPVYRTLLEVLREDLQLTGTKHGCELGECGTCTVLLDGMPALACLLLPIEVQSQEILTIEGMALGSTLHELQNTFSELGAAQCGYCTPGMLLTAMALLRTNPRPDRQQIKEALAGNLCRCTGYVKILEAVELAAQRC
jgi:aerobic-type carbon monoxide dehydrogenase small subunit (CoxS/CutS family)